MLHLCIYYIRYSLIRSVKYFLLSILILSTGVIQLAAQSDPRSSGRPSNFGIIVGTDSTQMPKPKLEYKYSTSGEFFTLRDFVDTTISNGFSYIDPARSENTSYLHLGYMGSSATPMELQNYVYRGFNTGHHQYDIYNLHKDSIRLYKVNRTIADLNFVSLSGSQSELVAKADYAQNFKNDITLNVNYKRYNFNHNYREALIRTTSFAVAFEYGSDTSRYRSFFAFLSNANNEIFNGGITSLESLDDPISVFRTNVPVNLESAVGRHYERTLRWYVNRKIYKNRFNAHFTMDYNWNYYFYNDAGKLDVNDSTVYKNLITDIRGIRMLTKTKILSPSAEIDFTYRSLALKGGIVYDLIWINDGESNNRNDISILFKGVVSPLQYWQINLNGHFGIGSNAGNVLIAANSTFDLKKVGSIAVDWKNYVTETGLFDQRIRVNEQLALNKDFNKIIGSRLHGRLNIPIAGLSLDVTQDLITNALYWDKNSEPQQFDEVYSHTTFKGSSEIKLWKFGLVNSGVYQIPTTNLYHLPQWYSIHDVYIRTKLFRNNLDIKLGTNLRVIPDQRETQSFNPLVGRFYQSDQNIPFYPEWNAYVTAKIKTFRIVIEYDNLYNFNTLDENINIANFPLTDARFRIGIRWLLLD